MSNAIETIQIPVVPNLGAFDERVYAGLSDVPAVIIGYDPMGNRSVKEDCTRQTKAVGDRLAELSEGEFEFETNDFYGFTGIPEHVDGYNERFWQVNNSWGKGHGLLLSNPGAEFMINVYSLDEPLDSGLFTKIVKKGFDPTSQESTFYFRTVPEHGRTGILTMLIEEGKQPPVRIRTYRGFVPLCSTIVFVNGSGLDNTLITHTTRSAYLGRDGEVKYTSHLRRQAAIGRVVVPGGVLIPAQSVDH